MEASRGRGRPRERSDDAALERERALRRARYHRKKGGSGLEEGESEIEKKQGKPRRVEGPEEELNSLKDRRERYEKAKLETRPLGRPRAEEGTSQQMLKRERDRRAYERKKEKALRVKLFPSQDGPLAANETAPSPILKSPSKPKRRSHEVLLLSPSKEEQQRYVRPSDDVTPKQDSVMASWNPKRRRSSSPFSTTSSISFSPNSTPTSSRASSPASIFSHSASHSPASRSATSRSPSSSLTSRSPTSRSPTSRSPTSRSPTSRSPTSRSPTSRSPTPHSPTSRSSTSRSSTSRFPASRFPASRSPASHSPASHSPASRSSSILSSRDRSSESAPRRGPKRTREREQLIDDTKKKERIRKRKWRELVRRWRKQTEMKETKKREDARRRMAKYRQHRRANNGTRTQELEIARKIVVNLRARLDKGLGCGTMEKEERAFRRMVTQAVVGGPESITREEIHQSLGISKNMVADARKMVAKESVAPSDNENARVPGRQLKSRFVTSALQRKRKPTRFNDLRRDVREFYDAKSTPTSRVRDVIKCWVSGNEETRQKRFLTDSITKLHQKFVHQHGPISRGLFFALRPKWVFTPTDADRLVCLCSRHTTLKFAYEDFVKICKDHNLPTPKAEHYVEIMDDFLCDEEVRSRDCLTEDCENCGITLLDDSLFSPFLRGLDSVSEVSFRCLDKDEHGRLGIIEKHESPAAFVEHVQKQLRGFPLHRFLSKHQQAEQESLLQNLNPDTVVILSDYAEKYSVKEMEEIQSLHWHSRSFTLFNSIAYFLVPDPANPGKFKKVKFYFSFFTERPEQDNYMASHCLRRILHWIKDEFHLSFKTVVLCSDKCGSQFCSRKVFGSIAESRRNLCVNHQTSDPLCPECPQVVTHFSAAGHGKCEIDSLGAGKKTRLRQKELAGTPLRTIHAIADFLLELNFIDLTKTKPGKEDSKGYFFSGSHGEVVMPDDVAVSSADWERIAGTRDLHQLVTTSVPGELLVRESSCFSCGSCEFGNFADCQRTKELGSIDKVVVKRIAASGSSVRSATRTRIGQERHRYECAELAKPGSIIAIARGQKQQLCLILVTAGKGDLPDSSFLKGKILAETDLYNQYTSLGAKLFTFSAELVRSPPLVFRTEEAMVNGRAVSVYVIEERELSSLTAEYLF